MVDSQSKRYLIRSGLAEKQRLGQDLLIRNFSTESVLQPILGEQDDDNESHHDVSEASNNDLGVAISDDELLDSCAEDLDNEDEGTDESLTALEILNRYCLKVKEEAMVSTRSMKLIRQVTICLMRATANQCQRQVNGVLQSYGVDPSQMPELEDAFEPAHWIHDSPELNDDNVALHHFPNISPREIVLGKRRQWKRLPNRKAKIVQIPEKLYYVSVLASLEVLLSNSKILQMVAEQGSNQSSSALLSNVTHGALFAEHELFSCDPHSLKIILYYDDLEITNGNTRRKHKLAMFYFQLANVNPEYRSRLKSINLLAITENKYLKKYGIDAILEPFVEELKVLGGDLGYHFNICGGKICFRGALLAVVADTPASNLLGGFKESVGGAKRKCRHCMADFDQMQSIFTEEGFDLRDEETHNYHLQQLEVNPGLYQHFSKEYGVVRKTVLLDAPYFNVTRQLPQDIMHVILEGALSRSLYFVLRWYLDHSVFTLDEVNHYIQNFPYGYTELKDKPVLITNEDLADPFKNLGQTAVQVWLLARVFSFFGEPYCDQFPDVWRVLQSVLEITSICCAKTISVNILGYLKGLLEEHLRLFKECFDANITPKQHYLVHLPSQIFLFGPPVRVWAMRFEAKHQYFKHIPRVTKNFKNLPKTLSERHQSGVCADNIPLSVDHDNASDHPLFRRDLQCGGAKVLEGDDMNEMLNMVKPFYPSFELREDSGIVGGIFQATSVTIFGTLYKVDINSILLAEMKDAFPVFGSISKIWMYQRFVFFALKVFETVNFCANVNAYEIKEEELPSGLFIIEAQDLLMTNVMHVYKHNEAMFVCPREDPNTLIE